MHALAIALAGLALAGAHPRRPLVLPVLEYHRVGVVRPGTPALTRRLTVDPRAFAAQMEWLVHEGYRSVTPAEVLAALDHGAALPRRPVLITFDDGYRDVLWQAAPVLRRLRLRATVFVITDRVGGADPSFLDWPELRRLERLGFSIGSHTVSHADLTALPAAAALGQLRGSRAALERRLGRPVRWISYPFGREDAAVLALARRAGYRLGVTEQPGAAQTAPLALHRDEVLGSTGLRELAGFVGR